MIGTAEAAEASMAPRVPTGLMVAAFVVATAEPLMGGRVTFSSLPAVSAAVLVADDATAYTVTATASADAGYNDIRSIRILFNITVAGGEQSKGRGYMAWGQTDGDINNYGGVWVLTDAAGGGRWGYATDIWGGAAYITPLACETITGGKATGGAGTRTVSFTFRAKPAWAANPVINNAACWAMTANDGPNESDFCKVGWLHNPASFDVVAAPCTRYAATPGAPILSNATAGTIDVAISPFDSDTDLYAIRVSPPRDDLQYVVVRYEYVQADGTIGSFPVWQRKAEWATTTVQGLISGTEYTFTVRAFGGEPGTCPSAWGPAAVGATSMLTRAIDCRGLGVAVRAGVYGMDAQPKMVSALSTAYTLDVSRNTSMRFGGDGYNWKTRTAQWGSNTTSTLQYLRYARDRNSYLQILTNTRGIGTGNGSTWVYTDQTPETLAALAADWVYYCNKLVQTKRQGDPLTAREQAILDSLDWGGDDKLLAPGEAMVPKVVWWEVGNEPEGPYPPPALTPGDYANRYRIISSAMLAQDPTIKVGPGCMTANNGNAWLDAVCSDSGNRVDFVAYHPYGNLYGITRDITGGTLSPPELMKGLNVQKNAQNSARQKIVDRLVANNRPAGTPLILSEWNTSSWQGTYYYGLGQTVAQGLGTAEDIFSFIEMGIVAAQYWDQPNIPNKAGLEVPCFKVFKALQTYLNGVLLDSLADGYFRLYTTRDDPGRRIILWGINLSEDRPAVLRIQLRHLDGRVSAITQRKLAAYSGATSLITRSSTIELVGWTESDLTGAIDPADCTFTFENATLTMLMIDLLPLPDFDRDDDVDLTDFAGFQYCFGGPNRPPGYAGCSAADLDEDNDVDLADFAILQRCFNGPNRLPACR